MLVFSSLYLRSSPFQADAHDQPHWRLGRSLGCICILATLEKHCLLNSMLSLSDFSSVWVQSTWQSHRNPHNIRTCFNKTELAELGLRGLRSVPSVFPGTVSCLFFLSWLESKRCRSRETWKLRWSLDFFIFIDQRSENSSQPVWKCKQR